MAFTDSAEVTATVSFLGVWIHDPSDPEGTVRQFLYGKGGRSANIGVEMHGRKYAGRVFPVYDHGDFQDSQLAVTVMVPFGSEWQDDISVLQEFARSRTTLVIRDNRGRAFYGAMRDYGEQDQDDGTSVSFSFDRVDRGEAA